MKHHVVYFGGFDELDKLHGVESMEKSCIEKNGERNGRRKKWDKLKDYKFSTENY